MNTIEKCNLYFLKKEREKRQKRKLKKLQSEIKQSFEEQLKNALLDEDRKELEFLTKRF